MGDVKYGTGVTLPGRAIRAMGAPGLYSGEPEAVGNYMAALYSARSALRKARHRSRKARYGKAPRT